MRKRTFADKIAIIRMILRIIMPLTVLASLALGIVIVNLIAETSPPSIEIQRAQEMAIMHKQAQRDKSEFERLRKKHGLTATTVVIYEPGEAPYYYKYGNEKIALK